MLPSPVKAHDFYCLEAEYIMMNSVSRAACLAAFAASLIPAALAAEVEAPDVIDKFSCVVAEHRTEIIIDRDHRTVRQGGVLVKDAFVDQETGTTLYSVNMGEQLYRVFIQDDRGLVERMSNNEIMDARCKRR